MSLFLSTIFLNKVWLIFTLLRDWFNILLFTATVIKEMTKERLSKNQKEALFVLAVAEVNGVLHHVALTKVKKTVDNLRGYICDPDNFRTGMHTLRKRGLIEMERRSDLGLMMRLTRLGRHDAAKIYHQRTGKQMDLPPKDDNQITIFEVEEQENGK
ncbi:hypothetical protein ACYAPA_003693 [Vibrio mimicus]